MALSTAVLLLQPQAWGAPTCRGALVSGGRTSWLVTAQHCLTHGAGVAFFRCAKAGSPPRPLAGARAFLDDESDLAFVAVRSENTDFPGRVADVAAPPRAWIRTQVGGRPEVFALSLASVPNRPRCARTCDTRVPLWGEAGAYESTGCAREGDSGSPVVSGPATDERLSGVVTRRSCEQLSIAAVHRALTIGRLTVGELLDHYDAVTRAPSDKVRSLSL